MATLIEQIGSEVGRIGAGGEGGVSVLEVEGEPTLVEFADGYVSQRYWAGNLLAILKTLRTNLAGAFEDDASHGTQETAEQKAYEAFWDACRPAKVREDGVPQDVLLEGTREGWHVEVTRYASGMVSATETAPGEEAHRREGRHDASAVVAVAELAYKRLIDQYEAKGFGSATWCENLERFLIATKDWS